MPQFAIDLENALFALSRLTPFAWLAVLGAAVAALGAAACFLGEAENELEGGGRRPLAPDAPGFRERIASIGIMENGFYVFLAGVVLLLIGVYPFVAAATAAAAG